MSTSLTNQAQNLAYYRNRQCNTQWRDFLSVLLEELDSNVGANEVRAFFNALGMKLAKRFPLNEHDTLEEFEANANQIWRELDWGWCQFSAETTQITVLHDGWPNPDEGNDSLWPLSFAALLQGIYTAWLRAQGGDASLEVNVIPTLPGAPLELKYGG